MRSKRTFGMCQDFYGPLIKTKTTFAMLQEDYVCYAAKGNSLLIRSTGRLAKCTVALNDSCNDIGSISENGEICVDQEKYQRWIAPLVESDWENVSCPLPSVMQHAQVDAAKQSELIC